MYDYEDRLATAADACTEYAFNAGRDRRDVCWILTSYDTWVANPFYEGPPQPHPDAYDCYEEEIDFDLPLPPVEERPPVVADDNDDIPF
jgi:hypothetical protein